MSGYLIIVGVVSLIALGVVLALIFWIVKLISNQNTIVDSNVVHPGGAGDRSYTTNTSDDDTFRRNQQAAETPSGEVVHSSHHDAGHDIGVSMGESTASSAMDFSSSSDSGSSSSDSGSSSSSSD